MMFGHHLHSSCKVLMAIKISFMDKVYKIYEAFLAGNAEGLRLIYLAYREELLVFGTKITKNEAAAEDAVAETFYVLLTKIGTFESQKHINNWLYVTVANQCYNYLRVAGRLDPITEDSPAIFETSLSRLDELEAEIHRKYWFEEVRLRANKLPNRQREIFLLYFFESMSITAISIQMGIAYDTVRVQLYRSQEKMRQYLRNKGFTGSLFLIFPFLF